MQDCGPHAVKGGTTKEVIRGLQRPAAIETLNISLGLNKNNFKY